jgi:hypothetical protein
MTKADGDWERKDQNPMEVDGPTKERILMASQDLSRADKMGHKWELSIKELREWKHGLK